MNTAAESCFHCGLPVPTDARVSIAWDGAARALCCRGCEAVARAILDAGLGDYYHQRSAHAPSAREPVPSALREFAVYDHPAIQKNFVRAQGALRGAALVLEGITCAACVWLNEQQLRRLPGVHEVQVNYSTRRARVTWDEARVRLSDILRAVRAIGYEAHPYDPARSQQVLANERRALLRRLGVAAIFGAQTMILSEALYLGDWGGSDPALREFFHWMSLLLTLPVLLYSSQPFFRAAWNDLRHGRAGMDVPVALGLLTAFAASLWTTVTGADTAYYDAVTMFAFLLLGGRYVELTARVRAAEAAESLVQATPALATRLRADGAPEQVAVAELAVNDMVLVRPGETIPADGIVVHGASSVNEALLSGESLPLPKRPRDRVIGGAINVESPLTIDIERTGSDTVLSAMLRLLDRAQAEKPRLAQLADRVAAWFVVAVLIVTAAVGLYWWQHDSARVLPIVIALLVVTCPCALGLATPAALSAATGALARAGLLVTRGHTLETLARATHVVFDKTGTLTQGRLQLRHIEPLARLDAARCLALAAALEQHSEHPIARALVRAALPASAPATQVENVPGAGLRGTIAGEAYFIGTPGFIESHTHCRCEHAALAAWRRDGASVILLASQHELLAAFVLEDSLRPGAAELVAHLRRHGRQVILLTGDHLDAAQRVAHSVGIETVHAGLAPEAKLAQLRALQAQGAIVAMIGDGVNDAPVLAAAPVSIAMGSAAHVSAAAGDAILLSNDLRQLIAGFHTAHRTLTIVRQNLAWALAYNLLAIPTAAAGLVTPWLAALGMSVSSALVVANALRLSTRAALK
jgi:Cu2+-exporting ATPase